ncbi:hypothetical protein P8452_61985 [Trifolium repens]|nr:hypothetical protein P8452_61985 [Trifolium repens]
MDREMVVDNGDIVNNDDLIGEINQVKSQLKLITNVGVGNEIQLLNVLIEDIDKRQRICVVALLCHIVRALHMLEIILPRHARNPTSRDHYEKECRRVQLMTHLVQTERCRDITRMSPATFLKLCEKLRSTEVPPEILHNPRFFPYFKDCIGAIDGTHSRVKHSEIKDWPSDHDFQVFKLEIENIFLIDWFGGPKPLTVEEYLHPKVNNHGFILRMLF